MEDALVELESSMCALLRGERVALRRLASPERADRFRELAVFHGLAPLLCSRLRQSCPEDAALGGRLFPPRELADATAVEMLRAAELERVLDGIVRAGLEALVLKGAALAHCVYPSAALRPRLDTDLLIRESHREPVERVLADLGYEKLAGISGRLVSYQHGFERRDRFGIEHALDVHWRISNTQAFSRALDYATLAARSAPVPALGKHARTLAPPDALLLACMHRVHHLHQPYSVGALSMRGVDRLIWIHDIHLLVEAMTSAELRAFARQVEQSRMTAVCRDGVTQAMRCFGTRVPDELLVALRHPAADDDSQRHLRRGRLRHLANELRSLPRLRDRTRLLAEHLFPSADYMLAKYSLGNRAWLPLLYALRSLHGAWKRISGP